MAIECERIVSGKFLKENSVEILNGLLPDIPDNGFVAGARANAAVAIDLHSLDAWSCRKVAPNRMIEAELCIDLSDFQPHEMFLIIIRLEILIEALFGAQAGRQVEREYDPDIILAAKLQSSGHFMDIERRYNHVEP